MDQIKSYVTHMFHVFSFSKNVEVPIALKQNKYYLSLDLFTTVFDWFSGISNKNRAYSV